MALPVALLVVLLCSCAAQSHKPLLEGAYILLLDIPEGQRSSPLPAGSKTYHSGGGQWNLPAELSNHVRAIVDRYDLKVIDVWPLEQIGELCVVVRIHPLDIEALKADKRIAAIQPVNHFDVLGAVAYNDPEFKLQFGDQAEQLERLHEWSTGENVKVGIIDTPVDLDHEDLRGQVSSQQIFVRKSLKEADLLHGTAVAGIIAAKANNGVGIVGFAPGVSLKSYAACYYRQDWQRTVCDTFALAKALSAAQADRLDIVNMSLSGPEDPLLSRLISELVRKGTIVIAADNPTDPERRFPASMAEVIAVTTPDDIRKVQPPDVKTGDENLTTKPGNRYQFYYGTSMAAAKVTALTSLMLSRQTASYAEARRLLTTLHGVCAQAQEAGTICSMGFALESDAAQFSVGL